MTPLTNYDAVLLRLGGEDDSVLHIADMFLELLPSMRETLWRTFNERNLAGFRDAVHSLRGSAAILSASEVVALGRHVEKMELSEEMKPIVQEFEALCLRLADEVGRWVEAGGRPDGD